MNQALPAASDTVRGCSSSPAACTRCGDEFACGVHAATPCWCASLPALAQVDPVGATCLCPACLAQALAAQRNQ